MNWLINMDYEPEYTKEEINLYHTINKLSKYIDEKKPVNKLNQTLKIAWWYNTKVEFKNPAQLYEVEQKYCRHVNDLYKKASYFKD